MKGYYKILLVGSERNHGRAPCIVPNREFSREYFVQCQILRIQTLTQKVLGVKAPNSHFLQKKEHQHKFLPSRRNSPHELKHRKFHSSQVPTFFVEVLWPLGFSGMSICNFRSSARNLSRVQDIAAAVFLEVSGYQTGRMRYKITSKQTHKKHIPTKIITHQNTTGLTHWYCSWFRYPAKELRLVELQGFIRPRWCRISSINSMTPLRINHKGNSNSGTHPPFPHYAHTTLIKNPLKYGKGMSKVASTHLWNTTLNLY